MVNYEIYTHCEAWMANVQSYKLLNTKYSYNNAQNRYIITRQMLTASWGEPDSTTWVASRAVCDYVYEIIRTVRYAHALLKPRTSWADGECISMDNWPYKVSTLLIYYLSRPYFLALFNSDFLVFSFHSHSIKSFTTSTE